MPFEPPFRDKFHKGDLIYGISEQLIRRRYTVAVERFEEVKNHYDNQGYPPIMISCYLIPSEIKVMNDFLEKYKDDENVRHVFKRKSYQKQLQYIEGDHYKNYKKSYFNHITVIPHQFYDLKTT
ncbi:MAG: hypothetical protein LBI71_00375 [Enterobacteriaceae bacterium]|jgi:hypothetical protein|nr:hypothetical protein [Enterobacteriaceae bacterium]